MTSDKDLRDNTRAMNNLTRGMASLEKVCAELNKNLTLHAKQLAPKVYDNPCRDYFCSNDNPHSHGAECTKSCSEPSCDGS